MSVWSRLLFSLRLSCAWDVSLSLLLLKTKFLTVSHEGMSVLAVIVGFAGGIAGV